MEDGLNREINSLPGLVWTALPDGHLNFVNRYWCEYTGIAINAACGIGLQTAIHPKDLAGFLERWQAIVASGKLGEMEARLRRFDRESRWFVFAMNPTCSDSGLGSIQESALNNLQSVMKDL